MPQLARPGGVMIHWDGLGSGPLVLLAPNANSEPSVYDPLEAELIGDHRVMRYDDRGTGASDRAGPFDMETGADDLEAVFEQAGAPGVVVTIGDAVHPAARVWLLYAESMTGGWFPAGEEGRRLARRLFPDAHVEEVEDGMISRPDLVAGFGRRVTSKGRVAAT
jgi:hypothetical protein